MPAGKDQLESLAWQPVPGAPDASIYPLIRKIDTISSNSYLLSTPDAIILIDPGGLSSQVELLSGVIGECRAKHERPVFVFLTHIHIDHFIGVQSNPAFAHPEAAIFAVQEAGAGALEVADPTLTVAAILETKLRPMKVGLPLATAERERTPGVPVPLTFPNGATITIVPDGYTGKNSHTLRHERITFGPGPALDIYHTPGHSPDSICLCMGDLFFIGDILFAASPGVAGMRGWSQQDLLATLPVVGELIAGGTIRMVLPGHGNVLPSNDAVRMLEMVRKDASTLSGITELNYERAVKIAEYAGDCMEQVNELFTIMAGRLQYTSYLMDELGEGGMAEEANALIRSDTIDELLETFRDYADEHHRGQKISVHLVLKAGQVIAKLGRTFNRDELGGIIDPTLVDRAARLLSDYTTLLRGFAPPGELSDHDIASLTEAVVTGVSVPPCSDEDVLTSGDDDAAFVRILLKRIGARPLLEDVDVTVSLGKNPLHVIIDGEHYADLLTYILEDLVGTGADRIAIHAQERGNSILILVTGNVPHQPVQQERRTWRFLRGLAERSGGSLAITGGDEAQQFEFEAPAAGVSPANS